MGRAQGRAGPWDSARCVEPHFLAGRVIGSVLEEQFVCENSSQAMQFRLNPDVVFREVKRYGKSSYIFRILEFQTIIRIPLLPGKMTRWT